MKIISLSIVILFLFACNSDEKKEQFESKSDWPTEEIYKMLERCHQNGSEDFNIDFACSCLVEAVSDNITYKDFKAIDSNQEGIFLPEEIELQEEVIKALLDCVD